MYRVVVADSRAARTGKIIEAIGLYNPLAHPIRLEVKETRLFLWLKRGAQPTDTVRSLLQRQGLWLKWSLTKRGLDEAAVAAEMEKWQLLQAEKSRRESEKKSRRAAARKKKATAGESAPSTASAPPAPAETPAA